MERGRFGLFHFSLPKIECPAFRGREISLSTVGRKVKTFILKFCVCFMQFSFAFSQVVMKGENHDENTQKNATFCGENCCSCCHSMAAR